MSAPANQPFHLTGAALRFFATQGFTSGPAGEGCRSAIGGFGEPEAVTSDSFLAWAAGVGVGFDPRYPDGHCLGLLPPRESARFWVLPGDGHTWPHFTGSILKGLDSWQTGYLWPRLGRWPAADASRSYSERVRDVVLRGAGIPDGWEGAVRYSRDERAAVIAVLLACLAFGWCSDDDLYFVPDHGKHVVQTDHHDVIHVDCADEGRVLELVKHLEGAGYPLPTEPPDATFRWPHWMAQRQAEPDAPADGGGMTAFPGS
jgi:hypothetical protein